MFKIYYWEWQVERVRNIFLREELLYLKKIQIGWFTFQNLIQFVNNRNLNGFYRGYEINTNIKNQKYALNKIIRESIFIIEYYRVNFFED